MKCDVCGIEYYLVIEALGHNWVEATCESAKYCENCNITEGSALGHKTSNGICVRCGVETEALKQAAIDEENKRHSREISEIEGYYEANISINEGTISSLQSQYGIGSVSSASYYQSRKSSLESERIDKLYKMNYTSNAAERAKLQKEIDSLSSQIEKINICLTICQLQDQIEYYEYQQTLAIASENQTHNSNLAAIEEKYG